MLSQSLSQNFQGELGVLSLPEILGVIQMGRKSGVLNLSYPDNRFNTSLLFKNGRVGRILTPFAPRLGEVLAGLGVDRNQLEGEGENWAERLSRAQVPPELISKALRSRVEMGLLPIFSFQKGRFDFAIDIPTTGFLDPGLELMSVILDLARRADELEASGGHYLDPFQQFHIASDPRDFAARMNDLTPSEYQIMGMLGETPLLRDLMQRLQWSWDQMSKSILELEKRGLIEMDPQREVRYDPRGHLTEGSPAPFFVLPDKDGFQVSLGTLRGKYTMLSFFRHAGCPFCNLRVHRLGLETARLQKNGLEVVGIFASSQQLLQEYVGRQNPPFPLLADEDSTIHDLYGCERSLWGLVKKMVSKERQEGLKLETSSEKVGSGHNTRLPSEFLVGPDLTIERVYYGKDIGDHLPLEEAEKWVVQSKAKRGGSQ
jgi:peroxiredoxin